MRQLLRADDDLQQTHTTTALALFHDKHFQTTRVIFFT